MLRRKRTIKKKSKKTIRNNNRKAKNMYKRKTTIKKMKGGENDAEKLIELLKRRSFGDLSVEDEEIYSLMNTIKNDNELYDAIYKMKKQLSNDEKDLFAKNAYFFQEDPSKVKRFSRCKFLPNCNRQNQIHHLSHTLNHPATLIAEAIKL